MAFLYKIQQLQRRVDILERIIERLKAHVNLPSDPDEETEPEPTEQPQKA
jgi:hypothetical protein